jgi:Plasma-membrane choline transporter
VPDMDVYAAAAAYQQSSNSSATTGHYSRTASAASWVGLFLSDLLTLKNIIFPLGIGLSTVLSFIYLYFLRIPGMLYCIIWTILIGIQCLLIAASILLLTLSKKWAVDDKAHYEVLTIQILAYIGFAMSFLFFCFLLVVRKRVSMAIGVIKETARALATMPVLILMPILQVLALCSFLVPWFIYVIFLASSGTTVTATATTSAGLTYTYRHFVYTENTKYAFLYMLFVWFWTSEFIVAVGQLTIALSLVAWYFTKEKKQIGNGTVFWVRRFYVYFMKIN